MELDTAWCPFAFVPDSPGSLVYHKGYYKPSTDGMLIYFTCASGNLSNELARVEPAGEKFHCLKSLLLKISVT